jgi:two-component system, OmpR family, sensor histidine kinase KdpD
MENVSPRATRHYGHEGDEYHGIGGNCRTRWHAKPMVEGVVIAEHADRARLATDTDRFRSALLASISHDLRAPIASILGSATTLSSCDALLDDATKQALILTIQDQAECLNRIIGNLLNITCLEAGHLQLRASPLELSDAIGAVLRRAGKLLASHRTEVRFQSNLPTLDLDAVLFEQVLFNLLDNASKHTPIGTLVTITAWQEGDVIHLQVLDEGPGISPQDLEHLFKKFYRAGIHQDCTGTGLGLAICLGFIEAMHGTITAGNRDDGKGAVFTITLPCRPMQSGPI